jgi:peptidoglycan/xylan/chitin deacetylase (PgdA/CDA1 family)
METLARYGTPIGIDDLIRAIDGGASLPRNAVMVTFDDGYRSCHEVALPILRAIGVRAAFFIPTSFITERRLYWWERISMALSQAKITVTTIPYPRPFVLDARSPYAQRQLTNIIKNTPGLDIDMFLDAVCTGLGVDWDRAIETAYANSLIMTWDQIRALARAGMDVESHSKEHRVLQTLDDAALQEELAGSRRDLEAQLGRPVRAIAYPVGRRILRQSRIREAVVSAGYKLGMTNGTGVTHLWPVPWRRMLPVDPFDISRLSTDRALSDAMFLTSVAVPKLAYHSKYL